MAVCTSCGQCAGPLTNHALARQSVQLFLVPSRSFDTTTTTISCFRLDTPCKTTFDGGDFCPIYPLILILLFPQPLPIHLWCNCALFPASTVFTTSPRPLRSRAVRHLTMTSTSNTPFATPATSTPNSRPGTPNLSTPPTSAAADNQLQDDSSKLRTFLGLLRKYVFTTWSLMLPLCSRTTIWLCQYHSADLTILTDLLASQISQMFAFLCLLN